MIEWSDSREDRLVSILFPWWNFLLQIWSFSMPKDAFLRAKKTCLKNFFLELKRWCCKHHAGTLLTDGHNSTPNKKMTIFTPKPLKGSKNREIYILYIYNISFEDDIEILQESMQGGMELERHKNYDVDYRWRSSLSLGGWHSWCQSKKSLRCINAAGMIKSILLSSKTLQEINKHLPTTGKSCLLSTSKTTYKKSM